MTTVAPERMASRLTVPFARGADILELHFGPGTTPVHGAFDPYDFREHEARFDRVPDPRYTVTALTDVPLATRLTIGYVAVQGGPQKTAIVDVPAGIIAGASFLVPLGADDGPAARLASLDAAPATGPDPVDEVWRATGLLGNLAKLLWVLATERDGLRGYVDQVRSQRSVSRARGLTLDLFGFDLGVQRFPPQPYSSGAAAVALYHLDDVPAAGKAEVETVVNLIERYGGRPHPGTNVATGGQPRAVSRVAGRFGGAFAFRDDAAVIEIANDADFTLAVGDSFTAECFVSADDVPTDGHALAKHQDPADATKPGWALSVGSFGRGIKRNVRFLVGDGTRVRTLFHDDSLAVARFYHVAGVIDRAAKEARLYVDGRLRASAAIGDLTALTNTQPALIGNTAGAPFKGTVDEVRLSRTAHSRFHPALGESDDSYKRRLQIFERWTLPTPTGVRDAINRVAGPVGGDSAPFLVEDQDSPTAHGRLAIKVEPVKIAAGRHIAGDADRQLDEADASGTTADDINFDPIFLNTDSGVKLQLGAARALGRLIGLPGVGAQLQVDGGYDPEAQSLQAVGRAVLLSHPALSPEKLAAAAHRAGFAWVEHREDDGKVYASVPPADLLEIRVTGGTATKSTGFDVLVGEQIQLTAGPPLPPNTLVEWTTIACGAGRATFLDRTDLPVTTLGPRAPGRLAVQLRVTRARHVYTTTLVLRVGLAELANTQSVDADGRLGVDETVAGRADDVFFDPTYLVTFPDDRATYGNVLENRRVQPAVAARLLRLLDLVAATASAGKLHVGKPAGSLAAIGRALLLDHASLPPERLGALCHAAGFTYARRDGTKIRVVQRAADLVSVQPIAPATTELAEGTTASFTVTPRAGPRAIALVGTRAFVACGATDTVTELDTTTGTVVSARKVGWEPIGLAATPGAGKSLFSLERQSRSVTRVDLSAGAVAETLDVGQEPVALAGHPTQGRLYVALANGNLVEVDTTVTPIAVTRTVALGGTPRAVAMGKNGGEAWVALAEGRVAVVDTGTFAAPPTIALPATPADIATTPTTAYVSVPSGGQLVIVDVATRTAQPPIVVAGSPGPVATAPNGAVFVLDTQGGVLLRRKANGDADGRVRTGANAADLLATNAQVYVLDGGADLVAVVDTSRLDVTAGWQIGTGLGERLTWTVSPTGFVRLSSTTLPQVDLTGAQAGQVVATATYVIPKRPPPEARATPPFTFEVRLKDALQNDKDVVITKDQYDLIMNVLNAFHPVGVEVVTEAIREKVIEVREGLIEVFPDYTYPNFRARGPDPRPPAVRRKEG